MTLLVISFIAGILTVLAPCIFPLLPVVIGRSVDGDNKYKPFVVAGSLAVAVVLFTLILKASTALIDIPPYVWSYISGGIIILFGLISLFPSTWEKISIKLKFSSSSNQLLNKTTRYKGFSGDVMLGLALGPVFSSCSPTYFLILATVLPQSYGKGLIYLIAYALGLALMMLLIGLLGQKLAKRLHSFSDPHGKFKKGLGILFIIVGIFIASGLDKQVQTYILDKGYFDITKLEQKLLIDPMEEKKERSSQKQTYEQYKEIINPSGFVNSEEFKLADLVGEKVILLDIMTYSCINCQRTFPYLNTWYETYKDEGLEIVGIHTPEFAFEKNIENVRDAAKRFELAFPLVLDNTYDTWNAYGNRYWPRKYLIDIHGNIVYDHIGEGAYDTTEKKIQELLEERKQVLNADIKLTKEMQKPENAEAVNHSVVKSPETYFGSLRAKFLGNATEENETIITFSQPLDIDPNKIYLVGTWDIQPEYAEAISDDARIIYGYTAQKVFLVMSSEKNVRLNVNVDNKKITSTSEGIHVKNGILPVQNEQLYRIIENEASSSHILDLEVEKGLRAFAFTFG